MAKEGVISIHGKDREYILFDDGVMYSVRRLNPTVSKQTGYQVVGMGRGNVKYLHELVLENFVSKRPKGTQASHKNGIRTDNRVENLCWETPKANTARQVGHGTRLRGSGRHNSVLTEEVAKQIVKEHRGLYGDNTNLGNKYGVSPNTIADLVKGRTWKWIKTQE